MRTAALLLLQQKWVGNLSDWLLRVWSMFFQSNQAFVNVNVEISILNNENCCSSSTTAVGGDSASLSYSELLLVAQSMGEILSKQPSFKICKS